MKKNLILIFLTITSSLFAQDVQKFYDWEWKECEPGLARFMAIIKQTDSGWLRKDYFLGTRKLQMSGLYRDQNTKTQNGWFSYYYANGRLSSTGRYVNDKEQGLWLSFHNNGMMSDSTVYENGEETGISMSWHPNGFVSDSTMYDHGVATKIYWYDNGAVSAAGHLLNGKKTGPWQYFHKNGKQAALETYEADKLVSYKYFNEEGVEGKKIKDRDAEFSGGNSAWQEFLLKHMRFPDQYKLTNTDRVTVVIKATIDEDGKVTDLFVDIPFDPRFDDIALDIMKKSPAWVPSISHNRRVKMYVRQPITFLQEEE